MGTSVTVTDVGHPRHRRTCLLCGTPVAARARVYTVELRGSYDDLLHRIVRRGVADLRRALDDADRDLPGFVWREFEKYDGCGDLRRGFAWLSCTNCEHHRLVPFSCKTRGFCPSCGGRRMAETAARWCDELLPVIPYRQWVITVPWARRKWLAYRPSLARRVRNRAIRRILDWARRRAREGLGLDDPQVGAVTATQRFGSDLRLNVHFHSIVPDGAWARARDGRLAFHRFAPTGAELQDLVQQIAADCEALFAAEGLDDEEVDPDDAQAVLVAASAEGRIAAGPRAGGSVRRLGSRRDEEGVTTGRAARWAGYSLHAATTVREDRRDALERLCRYLLRPPLAKGRLEERPDGNLVWTLRRPWSDGTEAFVYSPLELAEKLAAFVVPPRVHLVHYHGVFAPNASRRGEVVDAEQIRVRREEQEVAREELLLRKRARRQRRRVRIASAWCPWAQLLERIFGVGGFVCPKCAGGLVFRALVLDPTSASYILASLSKGARAGPTGPLLP